MDINVGGTWKATNPHVNVGGTWKPVSIGWVNVGGTWRKYFTSEFTYTVPANIANFNLYNTIGIPEADVINVIVPAGVTIYATSTSTPAFNIGNAYNGKTINIINKGGIYGMGGGASAGVGVAGGTALYLRTQNKVTIFNDGVIGGGGGGAGKGGTGGPGYYTTQSTIREPSSGSFDPNGSIQAGYFGGGADLLINGNRVARIEEQFSRVLANGMVFNYGGYIYYTSQYTGAGIGELKCNYIYRTRVVTNTINTNGGAGGNGGRGQGYNSVNQGGAGGAAGGANAGRGGTGGTGGTWGQPGATGNTGAGGNRGAGYGGSAGGRAGYAIDGNSLTIVKTVGSILGGRVN
ncbi:hypothetical protein CHOED_010 [Vibrio phage CHOED]|uniref:hypothetical protein n=1 Tax=Vibrio phage CHOED TaxID=1458716 RepID=UPI00042F3D90|nr:hypothetical protein CHOED_010 [Vibrio phage CHOED]AHK11870.1 hypothetical protein CHOED_010 [Vibrio phage CHOED]